MILTLVIERLGHRGDGIATTPDGAVHVAGALPGERVEVERIGTERARLVRVVAASPERVTPPCPHFGHCGGCAAQHMADDAYAGWKVDLLAQALDRRGLEGPLEPLLRVPPSSRRRVTLALAKGPRLGFHAARTGDVVEVPDCRIATARIVGALPALARLLAPLAPKTGTRDVTVLDTGAGLDVVVSGRPPGPAETRRLAESAGRLGLARISVGGEILATFRPPVVMVGGVGVVPPPGGFLQAVEAAEATLAAEVVRLVGPKAKRVADLFAGVGAFTFPLARGSAVHAVESERPALDALATGARAVQGLKPITTEARDLFRHPLQPSELNRFDALVLDPPRQGAEAQVAEIARSKVRRVAYVSCDPATFARDARVLVDAGFRIERITPVDQFLWTGHLELVAALGRLAKGTEHNF